ncbi:MAG TPA: PAS domain S-box protein [Methylomirabilota bacterium]|jgi:PAS domain S-box-containing protein|nr:PAS domain S-box protein [Methylomirabilota bacterium]
MERLDDLARAVFQSASEGILIADRAGTIVMVNARMQALFGYTRAELLGQPLEMLVPARARDAHVEYRAAFAAAPSIRPMGHGRDLAGRRKDGTEFPVEISLSFTETATGTLFIAFVTDITERQRAIEALRRSEAKARAILENASEGIVVVDAGGRIVSVNAKTEQMFRYDRTALIGQPLETLLPERLRGRHVHHRGDFMASPRTRPMGRGLDLTGRRADGEEFPVEISLSYMETEDGTHALAFVSDITQRLAVERATRQSERLAAVGQLAAGIAHEINNPVGIMSSRIELMLIEAQEQSLPDSVAADLRVLHRQAMRVTDIAAKLLTFARETPADRQPVDVNAVVTDALALVEKQLQRSGIRVESRLASDLSPVLGHANTLQQVILNLVSNAGQALGDHGTICITTAEDGAGRLVIQVSDDGPGIARDVLTHVFDPFFTTKPTGTGLGLSVSYGIVRDHGGTIEVQSAGDRGTTFTVALPVLRTPR